MALSRVVHGRLPAHFELKGLKTTSTVPNPRPVIQTLPSRGLLRLCWVRVIDIAFKSAKCALSAVRKKLLHGQPDVPRDLAEQDWRQVAATMHRHRGCATILMAELLVRASLPGFPETESGENGDDFARLENGAGGRWLSSLDNDLLADKLGLRRRSTVVQKH